MTLQDQRILEPQPSLDSPHTNPESPFLVQRSRLPVFGILLMAASVLRFLWELQGRGSQQQWILYGPAVQAGEWWRILSHAIEHGGVLHLFLNMSVVYTLGFALERVLGTARFAVISVVGCLGSAAFVLLFNFDKPTVGASGMILSWAGAILPIATSAGRKNLLMWLAQVAVISLIPGVSWAGHLGGFLFGLPCGLALRAGPRAFVLLAPILLAAAAAIAALAGQRAIHF